MLMLELVLVVYTITPVAVAVAVTFVHRRHGDSSHSAPPIRCARWRHILGACLRLLLVLVLMLVVVVQGICRRSFDHFRLLLRLSYSHSCNVGSGTDAFATAVGVVDIGSR